MSKVMIISGGNVSDDFALAFLKKEPWNLLIGADSGICFLRKHGISPTHIVGDFDSSGKEDLGWFRKNPKISIRSFRPEKDFTDTQIAVELAMELGAKEICILGGTGTRLDHVLANIRVLDLAIRHQVPCTLIDEYNKIYLKKESFTIEKKDQYGKYVSFFALGEPVSDLTLEGFYYPLRKYYMTGYDPLGVSNEITEEKGQIDFSTGTLIVIESKD